MKKLLILLISINCYSQDDIQTYILKEINLYRTNPVSKCKSDNILKYNLSLLELNKTYKLKFDKELSKNCFKWAKHISLEFEHDELDYHNESIYLGNYSKCVKLLILDTPDENNLSTDYGHRKHLMGMCLPFSDDTKIGIGYYKVRGNIYAIVIRTE